jgi:hypothetical protein
MSVTRVQVGRRLEGRQRSTNLFPGTDLSDRNNLHLRLSTRKHDDSVWIA